MLIWHWSHPTTPAGPGWDIVIDARVPLDSETGFIARAALGEADVIRLVIHDEDGDQDFKTLHRIYAVEDETPGEQLVWNGYVSDQFIDRGSGVVFPLATGRVWELEVAQENTILGFRVVVGTDGDRPVESPGERLTWLLASNYLSTVFDHGLIDWAGLNAWPDMNAVDYRTQTAADVLRDISLVTGFNHYARYRDASSDIELAFYEPNTSTLDTSTLRISNDAADLDPAGDYASTGVYAPDFDTNARLHRKGDRVSAGMVVPYGGTTPGFVYGYSLPTSYEFGFRDMVAPSNNLKTAAAAEALRDRLLVEHSTQDERVESVRIHVPAANVNDVKHGQRLEAKFTHLPGWEAFRWARAIFKTFGRPDNLSQEEYEVDLELSPQRPSDSFLIAFQANGFDDQPEDLSVVPWTPLEWTGDFTLHSVIACGAGPPSSEGGGVYARLISGGESSTVGEFKLDANSTGGTHVYQIGGIDIATVMGGLSSASSAVFVADGGDATISAVAATPSVLIGMFLGGKVNYDDGWCASSSSGWGGDLMTTVLGTQLVSASSYNTCGGQTPWVWIGYVTGTGTLTLRVNLDSNGGGSGAYTCGYNVGLVSLLIPLSDAFSIIQHGFGFADVPGDSYVVTLPSTP